MRKKNTRGCNLESASEVIDALGLEDILLLVAVSLEAEELGVLCALDVVPWVCGVTGPGQLVAAEGVAEDVARGHGGAEGNASSEGGESLVLANESEDAHGVGWLKEQRKKEQEVES